MVWPVFGRGAIGTIPSLIEITSPVPVSGAGANGTSGLSMVTVTPGPLEESPPLPLGPPPFPPSPPPPLLPPPL